MTTFPRLAGHDFFRQQPPTERRAFPVIWFTAALASSAIVVLGVSAWAIDTGYIIGALATAVVSVIGGYKSLRRNNKRDTKEAVREAVAPAVHDAVAPAVRDAVAPAVNRAIEASPFPTDPEQMKEFAKLAAPFMAAEIVPVLAAEIARQIAAASKQEKP